MDVKPMSMTTLKNKILAKVISSENLIRALVIEDEDFINATPTTEQQAILNEPDKLIRKQVFPYQKSNITATDSDVYLTMKFYGFTKERHAYQSGRITIYAITPLVLEPTIYGSRYDCIIDYVDDLLASSGIGKFEFYDRTDFIVDDKGEYIGASITFEVMDFRLDS